MSLSSLHPSFRPYAEWLYNAAKAAGANPRVTSTKRDTRTQQILFDRYQRTLTGRLRAGEQPQRYPVARPGTSRHELGAAIDIAVSPGWAARLGQAWQGIGGFWTASDAVHFSDTN